MSENMNVQPERRRPLAEMLSTVDELAMLIDAIQDYAIIILGPNGEIRSWNSGAARIFGYSAEEVAGKTFRMFYGSDEKPNHEILVASRTGRIEDEGYRIRKDGTRFWANSVITALKDDSGKLVGFAKVTRDLTARRDAEEKVRQSEELFRLLVSSVRDYAIFMLDPEGNITTWNAGAQRIKGYKPEEIIGKHFSTFYPVEDVASGKPARELEIAKKLGAVEDEGWRVRKDGTRFWANVIITAVFDSAGVLRGFAKVTRDMTERKHAEETATALLQQREARLQAEEERRRVEASYRVAQEANRAKDEFLMTLSHELRTPMTAILGWARLLPSMQPNEEMFREAVASIARSAEVQTKLIDDVLDLSRIVSGKLRLALENVDVARVLNAALETVKPSAEAKSISMERAFSPEIGSILADPTRLQQVVWNLLSNAVKFTPRRGRISLTARRTASNLQITVADTGEGIEPSFLPHIFEPFRQAENPSTRVHGGLGLGLSIVRYIAEAHGGSVAAESGGRGRGSMFTVTMPISAVVSPPSAAVAAARKREHRRIAGHELTGADILVLDDDPEGREMVRAVLRQAGAQVRIAESAAAANAALTEHRPDLIISDIAMPEIDGFTFARQLHQRPGFEDIKIIALTAFPRMKSSAPGTDFRAYLTKPIEPFDLIDAVAQAIRE